MSVETKSAAAPATGGWRAQLLQLAAIVLAVFIAKGALAEPFYVPSGSMEPTLLIGDALLASKYPYGYGTASLPIQISLPETGRVFGGTPKRGDVVVFRWPGDRSQAWVKRVKMVGNDMKLDTGVGTCGKNGQGVPVGVGQPTLRMDGLTVGGTAA